MTHFNPDFTEPTPSPFDFSKLLPDGLDQLLKEDGDLQAALIAGLERSESMSYDEQLHAVHDVFRKTLLDCGCPWCLQTAAHLRDNELPATDEGAGPEA